MLRMEDRLYGHHFYVSAATAIIETSLALHDKPLITAAAAAAAADGEDGGLSAAERKKAESKRKKVRLEIAVDFVSRRP